MLRLPTLASVIFGLLVVASAPAAPADETKKDEPKEKLIPAGSVSGTITKVTPGSKTFTLKVTNKVPVPQPPNSRNRVQWRDVSEEHEIFIAEDAKIRIPPKPEVDDKGRVKRPVIKKDPNDPDRNLPGVKGTAADLSTNVYATVYLGRNREKPPRTFATMVIVLGDVPSK